MIQRIHTKPKKIVEDKTLELEFSLHEFPIISARWNELKSQGWNLYVTNQRRGFCDYAKKFITLPLWVFSEYTQRKQKGYWVYYLAHEMAHTDTYGHGHDQVFMNRLKSLCPLEYQHYELEYMKTSAEVAGIDYSHAHKAVDVKVKNLWDILSGD